MNRAGWMAGAVTLLALGTFGTDSYTLSAYCIWLACPTVTRGNFLEHLFKLTHHFIPERHDS